MLADGDGPCLAGGMKIYRIGVIGLGQRIAHVLGAMVEVGWNLQLAGYCDPAPVGQPILEGFGIPMGRAYATPAELLAAGPYDLLMLGAACGWTCPCLETSGAARVRRGSPSASSWGSTCNAMRVLHVTSRSGVSRRKVLRTFPTYCAQQQLRALMASRC